MAITLHLIGNAHIDPVWLWDWREGLNEGIATCRTMVNLLQEFPEARFIRGEAAIYEHIQRHDPALFSAIGRLVKAGRWDIVGGNYIQPDTNLPATEALLRQFIRGKRYFRENFGVEVTSAWAADSFGHSAGLPEILAAAGMDSFAFTRPQMNVLKLAKPAFWWRSASGAKILAYRPEDGWYASERFDLEKRLDAALMTAEASGMEHTAMFYGLGNHGGGPTRLHLKHIRDWAARHPNIKVVHSGLHNYFASLRRELLFKRSDFLPTVEGELNFCLRGCSASVAKFKFPYRRAEARILRAEVVAAVAHVITGRKTASLAAAWDELLFGAFHDILPGSSIERAYEDQIAQIEGVSSAAQRVETHALLDLVRGIDTRPKKWMLRADQPEPVPVLLWNPHSRRVKTHVEIEVSLDHRPLWAYHKRPEDVPVEVRGANGRLCSHQTIVEEHDSLEGLPWRRRVVVPVDLPSLGWSVLHMGLAAKPRRRLSRSRVCALGSDAITNGTLRVTAIVGEKTVRFRHRTQAWLGKGLGVRVYDDPWGSWGGMNEESDSWLLNKEVECWPIVAVKILEEGPERATIWVRFGNGRSWLDLTFGLSRGDSHVHVRSRVLWNERSARLRLILPGGGPADYDVPGGVVRRDPCGEVPGGRWVVVGKGRNKVGFASDALYSFDTTAAEFRATVVRASRYASDVCRPSADRPWLPAVDAGELKFAFLLTPHVKGISNLASELECPPVILPVPKREGSLPRTGSCLSSLPDGVRLLALQRSDLGKIVLRLQNANDVAKKVTLMWLGSPLALGPIRAGEIASWQLTRHAASWRAERCSSAGK